MTRLSQFKMIGLALAVTLASASTLAQHSGHGSDEMKKSMESGMQSMQKMPMSGDPDKDFAMMMKMHHQQAVDMAKTELEHGKSPELKAMASKMIKDQTREIEQLDKWLQKQK